MKSLFILITSFSTSYEIINNNESSIECRFVQQDLWYTRHWETYLMTPRPRSGYPNKTTAGLERYLFRLCRNSWIKPSSELRADWILFTNVPVTTRLVNFERWLFSKTTFDEAPTAKKAPHKLDLCGCVVTWTCVIVTGNTLCSVTNPEFPVSSWSCSSAQIISRGSSTRWVCPA